MGRKRKSSEDSETTKPMRFMEISCKKRLSTLKKNASELAILCKAICIMEGPTGEVDIWLPESQAHAEAIVAKYRESNKKPKLYEEEVISQSTCRLMELEEEEKGNCMGGLEGFDVNEFLDKYFGEENGNDNGFDMDYGVIGHHELLPTLEYVEPNKGCSNNNVVGISEIDQLPHYNDYNGCISNARVVVEGTKTLWSLGSDINEKQILEEFDFSECRSTVNAVLHHGITSSLVEGDINHDQQNSNFSLDVEDYDIVPSDQDFGFLGDVLNGTTDHFSDDSKIDNGQMSTTTLVGYNDQHHDNDYVCGILRPSDTLWHFPQWSASEEAYDLPYVPDEFENMDNNFSSLLSSLDKPVSMDSNKFSGDIGRKLKEF